MNDSSRRRPPLRADIAPLRADTERMDVKSWKKSAELSKTESDDQRTSTSEDDDRTREDSTKEIDGVLSMLMDSCSLDPEILGSNLKDALDYFEALNTPNAKRQFLLTTFAMSLEDREFARSCGGLYGVMHTTKIEEDTVRSLLLSSIQKELEDNDFRSGNRQRFLNAVFLLSEMYYHIRFGDEQPVTILGGELLKYFRWLLTGEEKELEVLATCIIVNGLVLKKDKPASYRKLLLEIRTTLVTRNLSPQSRSWLLLIVDMDNANFASLPEELLMCHMTMIGDEGFQKFKRVRPTISMPSSSTNSNNIGSEKRSSLSNRRSPKQSPERRSSNRRSPKVSPDRRSSNRRSPKVSPDRRPSNRRSPKVSPDRRPSNRRSPKQSPERRLSGRQGSYEEWRTHEKKYVDKKFNIASQPPEDWENCDTQNSSERPSSLHKHQSSDDWQSSDSQRTTSRVFHKTRETQNRPQRNSQATNYSGRPFSSSANKRNVDIWAEPPPAVQSAFKSDKKIPVWQHQHDDRFDRDYNN